MDPTSNVVFCCREAPGAVVAIWMEWHGSIGLDVRVFHASKIKCQCLGSRVCSSDPGSVVADGAHVLTCHWAAVILFSFHPPTWWLVPLCAAGWPLAGAPSSRAPPRRWVAVSACRKDLGEAITGGHLQGGP